MQDIPRNELLDKLAAGWKVRMKGWGSSDFQDRLEGGRIRLEHLLGDSWEGEPSISLISGRCGIVFAFCELKENHAKFIRRKAWDKATKLTDCEGFMELECDDILANDWEVWG